MKCARRVRVDRAKVKGLWSVKIENGLASKKWQKCLARYTVSNSQYKVLYLCSVGFRVLPKKVSGRQSTSINW